MFREPNHACHEFDEHSVEVRSKFALYTLHLSSLVHPVSCPHSNKKLFVMIEEMIDRRKQVSLRVDDGEFGLRAQTTTAH